MRVRGHNSPPPSALWVPSLYPLGHLTRPSSLILTPALDLRQPVNGAESAPNNRSGSLHLNGRPNHTPSPARVWPCLDTKQLLPGTTGPPAWVRKWKLPHRLFRLSSKFCSRSFPSIWVAPWPPLQPPPVGIR